MADFADLDWAFTCPASVTDQDLRDGYEVLTHRFRGDGEHLVLNTGWQLLIERTITAYVKTKQAERRLYGQAGGFKDAGQEKDYNAYLNGLLHEVNDVLRKHQPNADRSVILGEVRRVMLDVFSTIDGSISKDTLVSRFATAFERAGL